MKKLLEVKGQIHKGLGLLEFYEDYFNNHDNEFYENLLSFQTNLYDLDTKLSNQVQPYVLGKNKEIKNLWNLYDSKFNRVMNTIEAQIFYKEQEVAFKLVDESKTELMWEVFGGETFYDESKRNFRKK